MKLTPQEQEDWIESREADITKAYEESNLSLLNTTPPEEDHISQEFEQLISQEGVY